MVTGWYVAPKYAWCNTQHLAIVIFRLSSMELSGSLPGYMEYHLRSWFKLVKTMHYINIPFNLDLNDEEELKQHTNQVTNKIKTLSEYAISCLKSYVVLMFYLGLAATV